MPPGQYRAGGSLQHMMTDLHCETIPGPPVESGLEPGEVAFSPAEVASQTAPTKRPLSLDVHASGDVPESKRVKDSHAVECLHCGSSSHRWTACMQVCMHCSQRHLGARCMFLPIVHYSPGGFKPNRHYRQPGVVLPALRLMPVEATVPQYMGVIHGLPIEKTSAFPMADGQLTVKAGMPIDTSASNDPHTPQLNTSSIMDAGRAALIAFTSERDFQPAQSGPVGETPSLGPRSSGANDMPLGTRNAATGTNGSLAPPVTTVKTEGSIHASTPLQRYTPAQLAGIGTALRGGLPAHDGNASSRKVQTPTVPPYGRTLFSKKNSAGIHSQPTSAQGPTFQPATGNVAVHDQAEWDSLEQHIKDAVVRTSRHGKPFNAKGRVEARIAQAIGILKPIILGGVQPPSTIVLEDASQPASTGTMGQQPTGNAMMQLSQPMATPPMQPPHPSPGGMMAWNWTAGGWQPMLQQ